MDKIVREPSRRIYDKIHTGDKIRVSITRGYEHDFYPWGNDVVPVLVIAKYPRFLVGTVMPHYNSTVCFNKSRPYNVTLDKFEVDYGYLKVTIS